MDLNFKEYSTEENTLYIMRWSRKRVAIVACGVAAFFIILILGITLPLSYGYVGYDEVALRKNSVTNKVDENKVYGNGRHYLGGAHYELIFFPITYQTTSFTYANGKRLRIFSGDIEIEIEVEIRWIIDASNLGTIFRKFGLGIANQVEVVSKTSIMNTASNFDVNEYINHRSDLTRALFEDLRSKLLEINVLVEPKGFQLLKVRIEDDLRNTYLAAAIQKINNEKALIQQRVDVIYAETDVMVKDIQANITRAQKSAEAEVIALERSALAESFRIQEEGRGRGIGAFIDELVIPPDMIKEFFNLLKSLDASNPRLILGDSGGDIILSLPPV